MSDDYVTEWESGKPETPCGKGSKLEETEIIRQWLVDVVCEYDIESIADVGCGDQNWIHEVDWPHEIDYTGYDVRPRYNDILPLDVTRELIDEVDLVLCVYVFNHLKPRQMQRAIRLLSESGSKYLLTSYCTFDKIDLPLLESIDHKKTARHEWKYGLFSLQNLGNVE